MKAALTKLNGQRNWALRAAADALNKSPLVTGKKVEISRSNPRRVTVDAAPAFVQNATEATGAFVGSFSSLQLP